MECTIFGKTFWCRSWWDCIIYIELPWLFPCVLAGPSFNFWSLPQHQLADKFFDSDVSARIALTFFKELLSPSKKVRAILAETSESEKLLLLLRERSKIKCLEFVSFSSLTELYDTRHWEAYPSTSWALSLLRVAAAGRGSMSRSMLALFKIVSAICWKLLTFKLVVGLNMSQANKRS